MEIPKLLFQQLTIKYIHAVGNTRIVRKRVKFLAKVFLTFIELGDIYSIVCDLSCVLNGGR